MSKAPASAQEISYYTLLGLLLLIGAIAGARGSYAAFAILRFPVSLGSKFTHGAIAILMAAISFLCLRLAYRLWLRAFKLYRSSPKAGDVKGDR